MKHLRLGPTQRLSTYRKVAIASWNHPRDPSTYTWLDLPVEAAESFLNNFPSDVKPSMTHFITKIVGYCLEKHPELNHLLRAGRLHRRLATDVFITTLIKGESGYDLSGFTLPDVGSKGLGTIAALSQEALKSLQSGSDPETNRTAAIVRFMPAWLLRLSFHLQSFFHYTLNLSLKALGISDDRFGSVMISNFGVLGVDHALVPLSPYCRCPLIIGVGRSRPMPIVRDKQVVPADCMSISFTMDHRYGDGAHAAQLMRLFQKLFLNPSRYSEVFAS